MTEFKVEMTHLSFICTASEWYAFVNLWCYSVSWSSAFFLNTFAIWYQEPDHIIFREKEIAISEDIIKEMFLITPSSLIFVWPRCEVFFFELYHRFIEDHIPSHYNHNHSLTTYNAEWSGEYKIQMTSQVL